jgi:large subunit ribosomal protein L9
MRVDAEVLAPLAQVYADMGVEPETPEVFSTMAYLAPGIGAIQISLGSIAAVMLLSRMSRERPCPSGKYMLGWQTAWVPIACLAIRVIPAELPVWMLRSADNVLCHGLALFGGGMGSRQKVGVFVSRYDGGAAGCPVLRNPCSAGGGDYDRGSGHVVRFQKKAGKKTGRIVQMKVLLTKTVESLGEAGELVNVSPGYARNFLFPRKLAVEATQGAMKMAETFKVKAMARKDQATAEAREIASGFRIGSHLNVTADDSGQLYGGIGEREIVQALSDKGFNFDRKQILVDSTSRRPASTRSK